MRVLLSCGILALAGCPVANAETSHWTATSTASIAVTGNISIHPDRIVFGNGTDIRITPAAADHPDVYRIDPPANPKLVNGNRLCGAEKGPTFIVLGRSDSAASLAQSFSLFLKVFDGSEVPGAWTAEGMIGGGPGLCAILNYERAASEPSGSRNGALGSDPVRQAQESLNALGYDAGPEDGAIGRRTRLALAAFQRKAGLPVTGAPDAGTLEALARAGEAANRGTPVSAATVATGKVGGSGTGTGTFTMLTGYDLPYSDYLSGTDDAGLRGIPLDVCQQRCAADERCQAFTYNTNVSVCILKEAVPQRVPFAAAISGIKMATTAVLPEAGSAPNGVGTLAVGADALPANADSMAPQRLESAPPDLPSFDSATAPDHNTLLGLYMAANADILDNDAFAWEHYLVRHIAPGDRRNPSDECFKLSLALENQFDREKRMERARELARAALRAAGDGARKHVFKIEDTVQLGTYDHKRQAFEYETFMLPHLFGGEVRIPRDESRRGRGYYGPVTNYCWVRPRDRGSVTAPLSGAEVMPRVGQLAGNNAAFALSIAPEDRLATLPISPGAAESYVKGLSGSGKYGFKAKVRLETLIEVGPASFNASNPGLVPARIVAARALHPETGEMLYTYDLAPIQNETAGEASPAIAEDTHSPLTGYRLTYLMLRDQPGLLSETGLFGLIAQQIRHEQVCYEKIGKIISSDRERARFLLNPALPAIAPSWQSVADSPRNPSYVPILEAFLSPEAPWSFATDAAGYDARFKHLVDAFVFDPTAIQGRDPAFLARELAPVFSNHLESALKDGGAPDRLRAVYPLPPVRFDFESSALRFVGSDGGFRDRVDLLPGPDDRADRSVPGFLYTASAHGYVDQPVRSRYPGVDYGCNSPTRHWRNQLSDLSNTGSSANVALPTLSFRHDLSIASLAYSAEEAERLKSELKGGSEGLLARVSFRVEQVSLSDRGRRPTTIFRSEVESVEIVKPDGTVLAHLGPSDFETFEGIAAAVADRDRLQIPKSVSVPATSLPDAETLDLLAVKFRPDALDDAMIERMLLARWEYENQVGQQGPPSWGAFFLREDKGKLLILDRPDTSRDAETVRLFRQWTLERASAVAGELVLRFEASGTRQGFFVFPGSASVDQDWAESELRSCQRGIEDDRVLGNVLRARSREPQCVRLAAALATPSGEIKYASSWMPRLVGPRVNCGRATLSKDHYCEATVAELQKKGTAASLIDVLSVDKLVHIGDEGADGLSGGLIELIVRVEGIEVAETLPPHAWHSVVGRAPSLPHDWSKPNIWSLSALSARLIDAETKQPIRELSLLPPPAVPDAEDQPSSARVMPRTGPDILGIELGMTFDEAEKRVREHMEVGMELFASRRSQIAAAIGKPAPFSSGRVFVSADTTDLIVLYDEPPAAEKVVVGVTRQKLLPKGQVAPASVVASLRSKYGPEDVLEERMMAGAMLIWGDKQIFGADGLANRQTCLPIDTEQRNERSIWLGTDGNAPDWKEDHKRANGGYPALRSSIGEIHRHCPRGLSALFEAAPERGEWDSSIQWLFDLGAYVPLLNESARLLESGAAVDSSQPPAIDLKL